MLIHQRTHHVKRIATDYLRLFEKLLHEIDLHAVERVVQRLQVASERSSTVYLAGNGGSASTASHWINDLSKRTARSGASAHTRDEFE